MKKTINQGKVLIDTDKTLNYETNNAMEKTVDFFLIPLLNSLSPKFQGLVKRTHKSADKIIRHKTSHKALEVLYNKGEDLEQKSILRRFFQYIWFNTNNSKAVRNRLKVVKRELQDAGQKIVDSGKTLKILSIASGSARAIIESVSNINISEDKDVFVSFIDKNPEAIEYSKEKVGEIKFSKNFKFNWYVDLASNFPKYLKKQGDSTEPLNIIEMVGLLDYFDDERTVRTFKIIYNHLETGGTFITANIDDNSERKFVSNFIDWKMIYRSDNELKELAKKAGFKEENIRVFYEPLKIHAILVAKK